MSESEVAHVAGCPSQPPDDQQSGFSGFCLGCALERQAEARAFETFLGLVAQWFVQPSWGRG